MPAGEDVNLHRIREKRRRCDSRKMYCRKRLQFMKRRLSNMTKERALLKSENLELILKMNDTRINLGTAAQERHSLLATNFKLMLKNNRMNKENNRLRLLVKSLSASFRQVMTNISTISEQLLNIGNLLDMNNAQRANYSEDILSSPEQSHFPRSGSTSSGRRQSATKSASVGPMIDGLIICNPRVTLERLDLRGATSSIITDGSSQAIHTIPTIDLHQARNAARHEMRGNLRQSAGSLSPIQEESSERFESRGPIRVRGRLGFRHRNFNAGMNDNGGRREARVEDYVGMTAREVVEICGNAVFNNPARNVTQKKKTGQIGRSSSVPEEAKNEEVAEGGDSEEEYEEDVGEMAEREEGQMKAIEDGDSNQTKGRLQEEEQEEEEGGVKEIMVEPSPGRSQIDTASRQEQKEEGVERETKERETEGEMSLFDSSILESSVTDEGQTEGASVTTPEVNPDQCRQVQVTPRDSALERELLMATPSFNNIVIRRPRVRRALTPVVDVSQLENIINTPSSVAGQTPDPTPIEKQPPVASELPEKCPETCLEVLPNENNQEEQGVEEEKEQDEDWHKKNEKRRKKLSQKQKHASGKEKGSCSSHKRSSSGINQELSVSTADNDRRTRRARNVVSYKEESCIRKLRR